MTSDRNNTPAETEQWSGVAPPPQIRPPHLVLVESDELLCFGARIRVARKRLSLSLDDVHRATRVPVAVLTAIEDMNADRLPDPVYLRGHLRCVTQAVGLDSRQIVDAYIDQCGMTAPQASSRPGHSRFFRGMVAAACVMLAASAAVFAPGVISGSPTVPEPLPQIVDAAPVVRSSGPKRKSLQLVAHRPTRIEIRGADGTVFVSRGVQPGEIFVIRRSWLVTADDGGALFWRLGQRDLGPLAVDGMRVYALGAASVLEADRVRLAGG